MNISQWFIAPGATAGPITYISVAVLAVLLVAVSKGGFGGGVGMLSVPLLLQVAGPEIVGMWLPVLVVCDCCTLPHYPKTWRPRALLHLVPGMFAGLAAGYFLLEPFGENKWLLQLGIGIISLVFVGLKLIRVWFDRHVKDKPAWTPGWTAGSFTGMTAGVSTMLAHAAGSIVQMYVLPQKLEKREFVGTCARFFFAFNLIKLPLFIFTGSSMKLTWPLLRSSIWMFALIPFGVWFGSWLNRKTDPRWFVRLVYFFLALAGIKLVLQALTA